MGVARLSLVVVALAASGLAATVENASACSCFQGDPRTMLVQSDAAFVGRLVEKRVPPDPKSTADLATYVFRVDEAVKGRLGSTVEVRSAIEGASCGIETTLGRPVGLFLARVGGEWRSSLCSQIEPARLRAAARPLPAPNGRGPVAFLVGGRFGLARTLALDARGRTLAYGYGEGETSLLALCPASRRALEVVTYATSKVDVQVRELRRLRTVRSRGLPPGVSAYPTAVGCGDELGRDALVFVTNLDFPERARILRAGPGGTTTVWRGSALYASFAGRTAYVSAGPKGRDLVAVDVRSGRARRLARMPAYTGTLAASPDGRLVAGVAYSAPLGRSAPPSRLVLVERRSGRVRSASLGRPNVSGTVAWLGRDRLVFLPDGEVTGVRVYDARLRLRSHFRGWRARGGVVRAGRAYGLGWQGTLVAARLPRGPARVVRSLPGPVASAIADVPPRLCS